ncbi:MAG: cytochrome P450 [Acidimicrobiia bacterium]
MIVTDSDLRWDPYDVEINTDPYPTFKRLRNEAPLYYNEQLDFYAVSRYPDVERGLKDRDTFISGRGGVLEIIKSGMQMPSGIVIFEDPPTHTIHRSLLSRMFTPRQVARIEPQIRQFCADALDPLVGSGRFDVIGELGAIMPARVIGMLLGLPDDDAAEVRRQSTSGTRRARTGYDSSNEGEMFSTPFGQQMAEYLDWRAEHPSDDIVTELLTVEFEDETGTTRTLTRDEVSTYSSVVLGAGNETTTRLIGWCCTLLAAHPEQRRQLVDDPSLVPQAIEEVLRFEPPPPVVGRYVAKDAEFQGQTVPAGSALLNLVGAANRDEDKFTDGEVFDINRAPVSHLSFGFGSHFCLGAGLARLEGRIALEELLLRFPEWDVDLSDATLEPVAMTRGWESLPLVIP